MPESDGTIIWGDYYATPTGSVTHDGLPLYDLNSLSLFEHALWNYVYIDGQFYPYDVDKQEYLAIPGRVSGSE